MNPCPCGFYGDSLKPCTCSQGAVNKYLQRISGPLLDRIDIHIEVPRLKHDELTTPPAGEGSNAIRARVETARQAQASRLAGTGLFCNAHMGAKQIQHFCDVQGDAKSLLKAAITQMSLSARAYDRILKLARTIADLAGEETIGIAHVAEAVQYRALDRKFWG
jgi:magnesium chelatase family protein